MTIHPSAARPPLQQLDVSSPGTSVAYGQPHISSHHLHICSSSFRTQKPQWENHRSKYTKAYFLRGVTRELCVCFRTKEYILQNEHLTSLGSDCITGLVLFVPFGGCLVWICSLRFAFCCRQVAAFPPLA